MTRAGKDVVLRWAAEMVVGGDLDVAGELFSPDLAASARQWVAPFRASFSDVQMQVVALVAEGDQVAGRVRCSGTHTGTWLGHPPTGDRFDVDEVYSSASTVAGSSRCGAWRTPPSASASSVSPDDRRHCTDCRTGPRWR